MISLRSPSSDRTANAIHSSEPPKYSKSKQTRNPGASVGRGLGDIVGDIAGDASLRRLEESSQCERSASQPHVCGGVPVPAQETRTDRLLKLHWAVVLCRMALMLQNVDV